MKVPYNWLKEIVSFRLSPASLAEKLTMAGLEVVGIDRIYGDAVLDIKVTANRPDCLGIIGVAREVNAILSSGVPNPKKITLPHIKLKESSELTRNNIKVLIQDTALCHRYLARVIKNVRVKQSPPWLKNRLKALGLRPINNVVDVTNYVLMEYGQPLHAFDFSKIRGQKIIVRRAEQGEEIVTLDGVRRKLDRSILIIGDAERPQAIAGIIGGMESEVTADSRDILLESAYFEQSSIRSASKKLELSTDSSYRFERGGDKEAVLLASRRAASLIQELAGGEVLKGGVDVYPYPFKPVKICLRLRRVNDIIGTEIEMSCIRSILKALDLKIERSDGELWRIQIPSFRRDLSLEIDLIEEIARHFGYGRIPAALPNITISPLHEELSYQVYKNVRDMMASAGFQEVVNFSFLSLKEIERARPGIEKGLPIPIKNPLSEEQGVMRLSLVHGLLKTAKLNLNRGEKDIKIFELGKIFFLKKTNAPEEEYCLGALALEEASPRHWRGVKDNIDFYYMKGVIELLLNRLGIGDAEFKRGSVSYLKRDSSAIISTNSKDIGWIGEIDEKTLQTFDVNQKVFLFELYLDEIIPSTVKTIRFKELPKFPISSRDISVIVPEKILSSEITKGIKKSGGLYLEKIELLDLYRGEQIPPGHLSLTYRLSFRSPHRTLREEEINNLLFKIIADLKAVFPVELREKMMIKV